MFFGTTKKRFYFIDDLINVIFLIFKKKQAIGKIFNIGSGKPKKIRDIITFINKYIKKGPLLFGAIKMRKDEVKQNYAEISRVKKILNWKPRVKIYEME